MFEFAQNTETQTLFESVTHLQDTLAGLEVESPLAFGISVDMELEQLQSVKQLLEEALAEAKKQAKMLELPECHIGPYANQICTICGMREPS